MTIKFSREGYTYKDKMPLFSIESTEQWAGEDRSGRDYHGVSLDEITLEELMKLTGDIHHEMVYNPIKEHFPYKPYKSYNTPDYMTQEEAKVLYEKEKYGTMRKDYLFNLAYGRYHKALARCFDPMTRYYKGEDEDGKSVFEYHPTGYKSRLYTPYRECKAIKTEMPTRWEDETLLEALEAYSEKLEKEIDVVYDK